MSTDDGWDSDVSDSDDDSQDDQQDYMDLGDVRRLSLATSVYDLSSLNPDISVSSSVSDLSGKKSRSATLERLKKSAMSGIAWTYICVDNLLGRCTAFQCPNIHLQQTCVWFNCKGRIFRRWKALSLEDSTKLEKCYRDVTVVTASCSLRKGKKPVDFANMKLGRNKLKRVSTPPATAQYQHQYATVWDWYYINAQGEWTRFEKSRNSSEGALDIEGAYQKKLLYMRFRHGLHRYRIDFKNMRLMNVAQRLETPIRRRPSYRTLKEIQEESGRNQVGGVHIETLEKPDDMKDDLAIRLGNAVRNRAYIKLPPRHNRHAASTASVSVIKRTICTRFLSSDCTLEDACPDLHRTMRYQWMWMGNQDKLHSLPKASNVEMEKQYCDPFNNQGKVSWTGGALTVDFETMTGSQSAGGRSYKVIRSSTPSSGGEVQSSYCTTWCWYWKDNDGAWVAYPMNSTDRKMMTSPRIERSYQKKMGKVEFKTGDFQYTVNFQTMVQINNETCKERVVRRRPMAAGEQQFENCPSHWTRPIYFNKYKVVEVDDALVSRMDQEHKTEYKQVHSRFKETCSDHTITKVQCVQNAKLYEDYCRKRTEMQRKLKAGDMNEVLLFHGTKAEHLPAIYQHGFDFRLAGQTTGAIYGRGAYFARNASYSHKYVEGGMMLVAKVLAGRYAEGDAKFSRPPLVDPKDLQGPLYDSCVDDTDDPHIFVIFDFDQAFPAYVITYQ